MGSSAQLLLCSHGHVSTHVKLTVISSFLHEKKKTSICGPTCGVSAPVAPPPPFSPAHLGILLVVVLLRPDPAAHKVVPHCVGQGEVVVPLGGHVAVLDQREVQVPVEVGLQVGHVLHAGETPHRDLLPFVLVAQRPGHGAAGPDFGSGPGPVWSVLVRRSAVPPTSVVAEPPSCSDVPTNRLSLCDVVTVNRRMKRKYQTCRIFKIRLRLLRRIVSRTHKDA